MTNILILVVLLVAAIALIAVVVKSGKEPDSNFMFHDAYDAIFGLRQWMKAKRPDMNPWADRILSGIIDNLLDIEVTMQNKPVEEDKADGQ